MDLKEKLRKLCRTDLFCVVLIALTIASFHGRVIQGRAVFPFDYENYHLSILSFIGHEVSNGRLPFYDPYVYSGMPFLLNTQSALFYPVHLLVFGVVALLKTQPSHYMFNLFGILHFILGGISFYFLARHYGIRKSLSVAGSVLYSLNGHILAQTQHMGVIETYGWLPLLFLLTSRFFQKPGLRLAVWIGIVFAFLVLIGFLPLVVAVTIALIVYASVLLIADRSDFWRKLTYLSGAALIAICLTAAVTIPIIMAEQPMEQLSIHHPLPASSLKMFVWPNVFKSLDLNGYHGAGDPTITYLYAGLLVPLLALWGLFLVRKKAPETIVCFIISSLFAFTPVLISSGIYKLSAFAALVRPENFLYFVSLFGVLLSLFALESLWENQRVLVPIIAILAAATLVPMLRKPPLTKFDASVSAATVVFSLASLAILSLKQNSVGLIGLLAAGHLFAVNLNCPMWAMRIRPGATTYDAIEYNHTDLLSTMRNSSEPYRVAVDFAHMGGFWHAGWRIWRIESIGGFEPIRSQQYLDSVTKELSTWENARLFNVARLDSPLLDLLNVKFLVGRGDYPPDRLPSHWRKLHEGFWETYENLHFHSRYAVVPLESVKINPDGRNVTYQPGTPRAGRIAISAMRPGYSKLSATVDSSRAFLFISERNYRGWEITVDGQPVHLMTANELFMGIPVAQGHHTVVLQFKQPYIQLISFLTALGICLALVGFVLGKPGSNRGHPDSNPPMV